MYKIQSLISKQEKEILSSLNEFMAEKINKIFEKNSAILAVYKTGNSQFWLKNVIEIPISKHTLYATFNRLNISDKSYSFCGNGKIHLFNYLDGTSLQEHFTFCSFNYKIEKSNIICSIRAKNLPNFSFYECKEKIKNLNWSGEIEKFSLVIEDLRKLNESTTVKSTL